MTLTKISLNITPDTKEALDAIRGATGMTTTEQFRKGIRLLQYILDAQKEGEQFRVYEKDGDYRVLEIILP
jgi:hypothetical protein